MKQVSIFAANTKGAMNRITELLKEADINLIALVTNDSAEFGIIRMLVSDPDKAKEVLTNAGYLVQLTEVIGVEISDKCGGLNALLEDITKSNINVEYLYISYLRDSASNVIAVFHVSDESEIEESLTAKGWKIF
ncbi:MAG: amino acid-binding protein [Oscillospiraceae bacterium]|nr:amino acid-binding protein [Oscillospiraceae bacterium]